MFKPLLISLVLAISLTPLHALIDGHKETLKQLGVAVEKEIQLSKNKSGRQDIWPQLLSSLKRTLATPDQDNAEEAVTQILVYYKSPEVVALAEKLGAEIVAERADQEKREIERLEGIASRAVETAMKANRAADLDALLAEFAVGRSERNYRSQPVQASSQKVDSARQFVLKWQSYLFAKETNDNRAAIKVLEQFLSDSSNIPAGALPRSKIMAMLARERGDVSFSDVLAKLQSLDGMTTALAQLRGLQSSRSDGGDADVSALIQALTPLEKSFREFVAGVPTGVDVSQSYMDSLKTGLDIVTKLRSDLIMLMLPRYVGIAEDTKPRAGETLDGFIDRLAAEAKERGDYQAGLNIHLARQLIRRGSASGDDVTGYKTFAGAQNQEAAGQFDLAVASYQNALKSGSELVPAKFVGERLAAIKAAHPEAYEQGMLLFSDPPPSRYTSRDRMEEMMTMRQRQMMDGGSGRDQPAVPRLMVPPVNNNPGARGKEPDPVGKTAPPAAPIPNLDVILAGERVIRLIGQGEIRIGNNQSIEFAQLEEILGRWGPNSGELPPTLISEKTVPELRIQQILQAFRSAKVMRYSSRLDMPPAADEAAEKK